MVKPTTWNLLAAAALTLAAGGAFPQSRNLSVAGQPRHEQPASEQRVALVIGNADYEQGWLRNPVNDARAIASELRETGFNVTVLENANLESMFEAIREFGDRLRAAGVGVFYFAGHGVQIRGRNYLIPVAAQIQREDEVAYRAIDAGQVLQKMDTANNRVNIVILDACRNNPFSRTFRSPPAGLAVMEAPVNTLVAFSTSPGAVAADGTGKHGLYTEHLLKNIPVEGLRVEDMFKRVRAGVRADSGGRQTPWENTSLEGEFYFRPLAAQVASPAPLANPLAIELAFWESIKASSQWADFDAYLRKYPSGQFYELARNRLGALKSSAPVVAAAAAVPVATIHKPPSKPMQAQMLASGSEIASTAMAVPATGGYVVSGSRDGVLSIWDVSTSRELRRLMGHAGAIRALAVSPDGRWIASGGDDSTLRFWTISGPGELRRVAAGSVVTALAYSPNGRYLASADRAGSVQVLNASDGKLITRFPGHSAAVRTVAFSNEGRYVLSGGADGVVRVWDVSSGAAARTSGPHSSDVVAVRMSPDGASIVSASADGAVWSWDVRTGNRSSMTAAAPAAGAMVAFSTDGRSALIARDDGTTVLWDIGANHEIGRFSAPASAVTAVALSSEARLALVAADGQKIRLWAIKE